MPEPKSPKPPFWTSLEFLLIAGIVWCLLMTTLLVNNLIAPLTVGILALITIPALVALVVFQIKEKRKYPPPPEPTDPRLIKKNIRHRLIRTVFYAFYLFGVWSFGLNGLGVLLLAQIPAAAFLLALIAFQLRYILKLWRKLKR